MRSPDNALIEKRRTQVLDAAVQCFLKSGFHNTGMKEICQAAQLSPGGLYRYFSGKDAIIQAIAEREQQELASALTALRHARHFRRSLLVFMEEATKEACCLPDNILGTEIFAESTRNEAVFETLKRTQDSFLQAMESILAEAAENGKVDLKLPPDETAKVLLSLIYGDSTVALLDRQSSSRKAAKRVARVVECLV